MQIVDEEAKHAIAIHRDNFVDAVIWRASVLENPAVVACQTNSMQAYGDTDSCLIARRNPWIEKAKATADFGDDEYRVR